LPAWAHGLLNEARVGHLATTTRTGIPAIVPVCFVFSHGLVYTPIDEKPKIVESTKLRRIRNIHENPQVAFIVDEYNENWRNLRHVILFGRATIITAGTEHGRIISLLRMKYSQYKAMRLEERPVVRIKPLRVKVWKPT